MNKILISHRGNLNGIIHEKENSPDYIIDALKYDIDVEIDVWKINDKLYLGHDEPQYLIQEEFLYNNRFWCHAKNYEALEFMLDKNIHCFWHENDTFTLTSKGVIWQYPSNIIYNNSIFLYPEKFNVDLNNVKGICSDYIINYKL